MYYYKITDKYVYKYDVILNIKQLHDTKNEIIDKCSFISHKSIKTTTPDQPIKVNYRNYKKTKINETEYLIEYDCLEIPMLVDYIVDLLLGDMAAIDKIINYEENMNNLNLEEKQILKESDRIINLLKDESVDISKFLELLSKNYKKLSDYRKDRDFNKKRKNSNDYVKEVLNCINFKLVSCLNKNEFYNELKESENSTDSKFYKDFTKGTCK